MNTHTDQIKQYKKELHKHLAQVKNSDELEQVRITFLGRQGRLTELMKLLKSASLEEKKILGPALNALKQEAEAAYQEKKEALVQKKIEKKVAEKKDFDVTASEYDPLTGRLHIYTQITQELERIFISMGYTVADGPEVETDYYNFQALNIPAEHPARDMFDTFWLTLPNRLLRTHTSSVQIHQMEQQGPPLAVFAPGRVFRHEAIDASHDIMFNQGEVLVVDENISMAHLLATAKTFLKAVFKTHDIEIRVRPGYFPFVEPGVEIDASCPFCSDGCSICKKTGWIELLGAGLVHPNVLKYGGIDTQKYSGFALGFGLERLAMIRYGINDIRLFHQSQIPFLDQF